MNNLPVIFAFLCFLLCAGLAQPKALSNGEQKRMFISSDDARRLVLAALPKESRSLPKLGVDVHIDSQQPRFYFVFVTWAGAPNGSVVVGSYEVDRATGDVWDAVQECYRESNPSLEKLQAKIRLQHGRSSVSQFGHDGSKGPHCQ